jgi:hypothetical protein
MRSLSIGKCLRIALVVLALALVAACHRGGSKKNVVQADNIPASFDVTLKAEKDNQFDYLDAPLTSEDLKSALRYRQEQTLPVSTVLLKRSEKQQIKKEHQAAIALIAHQMGFKAFMEEGDGVITELQARDAAIEAAAPAPTPTPDKGKP